MKLGLFLFLCGCVYASSWWAAVTIGPLYDPYCIGLAPMLWAAVGIETIVVVASVAIEAIPNRLFGAEKEAKAKE